MKTQFYLRNTSVFFTVKKSFEAYKPNKSYNVLTDTVLNIMTNFIPIEINVIKRTYDTKNFIIFCL